MSFSPAKAADLGGDCCADLEERVAELEATTVRKGNKKVSLTISGWVVKLGEWWDDGGEQNFYVGDKHTTLSSHVQFSGQATIAPGWSGGYTLSIEMRGGSAPGDNNQFNDNAANIPPLGADILSNQNILLSYMWVKSDKYGTVNWGQLSQATDNVALLPDLSGTIIEANAVLFDGQAMLIRPSGVGSNAGSLSGITWGGVLNCISGGGGIGADCNGYPQNGFRYDTPTFAGFSVSGGYYEDDVADVAVKYAADWNNFKVAAAFGYTKVTDEGCTQVLGICALVLTGGGGAPFQGFKRDVDIFQVGASGMHVPSGLFIYGLWQEEQNHGTTLQAGLNSNTVWYLKGGIKRTWTPLGATVLFGEWGEYKDMFGGASGNLCGASPGVVTNPATGVQSVGAGGALAGAPVCAGIVGTQTVLATGSEVTRYGLGVVQEIDAAAMHLFARWQHLDLDLDLLNTTTGVTANQGFQDLEIFQIGGVIFF